MYYLHSVFSPLAFLIQFDNLCLLIEVFRPVILNVIVGMVGLNLPSCCFLFISSVLCSFSSHYWINWNTLFYSPFISSVVLFIIPLCFIFSVVAIGLSICIFDLWMTDWM